MSSHLVEIHFIISFIRFCTCAPFRLLWILSIFCFIVYDRINCFIMTVYCGTWNTSAHIFDGFGQINTCSNIFVCNYFFIWKQMTSNRLLYMLTYVSWHQHNTDQTMKHQGDVESGRLFLCLTVTDDS